VGVVNQKHDFDWQTRINLKLYTKKISFRSQAQMLKSTRGTLRTRPRAGRPRKTTPREDRLISRRARQQLFSTAGALRGNLAFGGHISTRTVIRIKNVQVQLTVNGKTTSDSYTPTPKSSCAQNVVVLK
jgi:hypothetical protein